MSTSMSTSLMNLSDATVRVMCVQSKLLSLGDRWRKWPSHNQTDVVTRGPDHLRMSFWWTDLRTLWGQIDSCWLPGSLQMQVSRRQPDQMPPQWLKGQRFYSELPLDVKDPHLISLAPRCLLDETQRRPRENNRHCPHMYAIKSGEWQTHLCDVSINTDECAGSLSCLHLSVRFPIESSWAPFYIPSIFCASFQSSFFFN